MFLIPWPSPFQRTPITLSRVLEYREKEPRRIDFARTHANVLKRQTVPKRPDIIGNISFPFSETIKPLFETGTGISLFHSAQYDNYWYSIQDEAEFGTIQEWIKAQGSRIFLRNALDLSIALDCNLVDNQTGTYTSIGALEHKAKTNHDMSAVQMLSDECAATISSIPFFKNAAFVCSVPDMSEKGFDLPSSIAAGVGAALERNDITRYFQWKNSKVMPLKEAQIHEKWSVLEQTGLCLNSELPKDSDVVLIDDKYQSGTTMQFVAMKLQEAGARHIFGISLVKTLRDTDNAS